MAKRTVAMTVVLATAVMGQPSAIDPRLQAWQGNWASRDPIVPPPLSELWQEKVEAVLREEREFGDLDNNRRRCIPNGMPTAFRNSLTIWLRPGAISMLGDSINLRRVYTDGRSHTPEEELPLSYTGESIGRWDGDTLVVDTIGLMRSNEIADGVGNARLHIVERFSFADGRLTVETRVEDPHALVRPWEYTRTFSRQAPPVSYTESYCVQSLDRTFDPITGEQTLRIAPDPVQEEP